MTPRSALRVTAPLAAASLTALAAQAEGVHPPIHVTSPAFAAGGAIPALYSCDGAGQSPPLAWSNVPRQTKSIAVVVDDPDAPRGTFVHWVVYGIAPSTSSLPTDAARATAPGAFAQGTNTKGDTGFAPFCPPSGTHHYRFKVYALDDVPVSLDKASVDDLQHAMNGHTLATGQLVATYSRGSR